MSLFGKKKPTKKRTKPITAKLPEKQKATTAQHKSAATAARTTATASPTKTTANKSKATTKYAHNSKSNTATTQKQSIFSFRRYHKEEGKSKEKHPKLIVDTEENTYTFLGLTKSRKSGHHLNIPLDVNPQKDNKEKAYLRKDIRKDTKDNFEGILKDYNLCKTDEQKVITHLESKKRK